MKCIQPLSKQKIWTVCCRASHHEAEHKWLQRSWGRTRFYFLVWQRSDVCTDVCESTNGWEIFTLHKWTWNFRQQDGMIQNAPQLVSIIWLLMVVNHLDLKNILHKQKVLAAAHSESVSPFFPLTTIIPPWTCFIHKIRESSWNIHNFSLLRPHLVSFQNCFHLFLCFVVDVSNWSCDKHFWEIFLIFFPRTNNLFLMVHWRWQVMGISNTIFFFSFFFLLRISSTRSTHENARPFCGPSHLMSGSSRRSLVAGARIYVVLRSPWRQESRDVETKKKVVRSCLWIKESSTSAHCSWKWFHVYAQKRPETNWTAEQPRRRSENVCSIAHWNVTGRRGENWEAISVSS